MKGMLRWHWYGSGFMKTQKKFGIIAIIGIFIVLASVSCSGGTTTVTVAPADYESVKSQLTASKAQLDSLQADLAEARLLASQYEELQSTRDELQKQLDKKTGEYNTLKSQYDALVQASGSGDQAYQELVRQNAAYAEELAGLQTRYDELKAEHDLIVKQAADVTETNIKNALWESINNDRTANGLTALLPGNNIAPKAHLLSQEMARLKQLIYDNQYGVPYQDVFQAAGYRSVDDLVNATMIIWKSEAVRYELNVLNSGAVYGTVDVVSEGGIFYITFMASNFP